MNPNPLVSVVIPAYNVEQYVIQTLESVIRQTYLHLEIIVVDDGSTDSTSSILQRYAQKDPRIQIITQSNKGLAGARNTGLHAAKGEYVCIIDADDIMLPEKVASQLAFLEQFPEADVTYSKMFYFDDTTKELRLNDLATPEGRSVYKALLRHGNLISPNAVFFKRKVVETIGGFDERLRSAEDLDYWLLLASKGVTMVHQPERLTLGRMRTNSLTADSVTMYQSVVAVFEKHLHTRWSKFTNGQYLKNRFLLWLAYVRKPNNGSNVGSTIGQRAVSPRGIRHAVNVLYHWVRNMKFSLKYKTTYNQEVHEYLMSLESINPMSASL